MRKISLASALMLLSCPAWASLTTFQNYVGTYGVSTDGWGSVDTSSGTISASVPAGATVVAAYLYTASWGGAAAAGGTLNGNVVAYGAAVGNATACCSLASRRADVTSIVAPVIDGGLGGTYNFTVSEDDTSLQDGEALVVVYSLASLAPTTIGILDGYASVTGDTATISFADPLNPSNPGFVADMFLGINFSCCSQQSTVAVNGTVITESAGNNDDNVDPALSNGNLITVGGFNDPYSSLLPGYDDDHEKYNLIPHIANGATSIQIATSNASEDDNIFLAVFQVTGEGTVTSTGDAPEPGTMLLFGGAALAFLGVRRVRRNA